MEEETTNVVANHRIYADIFKKKKRVWKRMSRHVVASRSLQGCLDHNYASTHKTKMYAQVRYKNKKYYCHVVAAMIRSKRPPEIGEEASHLCGRPTCIEPKHLTFESGPVNKSRRCCHLYLGKHPRYICPHEPQCIVARAEGGNNNNNK